MSGNVTPFVDFLTSTDSGENNNTSIQPITDGEKMNQTVLRRPDEALRKRTEVLRSAAVDSQFLQNADRVLVIAGPGKVTWPGSTTALKTGIPVLSDVLWILPMLTPGFAQTQPLPPVASAYGTLHLKRASDNLNSILVTSQRRSYAAGDQINIVVSAGGVYSCVLDVEDTGTYRRTIKIVATPITTLGDVITSLNGLTPPAPDNTQLVTAALENGALSGNNILDTQARQFVSGNYDGEGHTITPANLASFFTSNPTEVLAEGDTLCAQFAMLNDTASTGGRRQAIPENTNTTITAAMFFNSRVHPEKLVNSLPICKVINGALVFGTGAAIAAGDVLVDLNGASTASAVIRNGGFEHGVTASSVRFAISDWEITAGVSGAFSLVAAGMESGGKCLQFNCAATTGVSGAIEQRLEVPVVPGQKLRILLSTKQLKAPVAGNHYVQINWGDANSAAASFATYDFTNLGVVDSVFQKNDVTITVPASKYFVKSIQILVDSFEVGSTGVSLLVDNFQMFVAPADVVTAPAANNSRVRPVIADAVIVEDQATYQVGQLAALLRFDKAAPASEGSLILERKDQDAASFAPALVLLNRLLDVGKGNLIGAAGLAKPRISMPHHDTLDHTLLFESHPLSLGGVTLDIGYRIYATAYDGNLAPRDAQLSIVTNAVFGGTTWSKDTNGTPATMLQFRPEGLRLYTRGADENGTWLTTAWTPASLQAGPRIATNATPYYEPLLSFFDGVGSRRVAVDHLGMRGGGRVLEILQPWIGTTTPGPPVTFASGWGYSNGGTSHTAPSLIGPNIKGPQLVLGVVANADLTYFFSPYVISSQSGAWPTNMIHVLEFEIDATDLTGTPNLSLEMGFRQGGGVPQTNDHIAISKTSASANWFFKTRNNAGGPTTVNTTVAAGGVQRFRIEVYTGGTPGGARALCFIDGVLRAEITATLPDTDNLAINGGLLSTGATNKIVPVSPISYRASRYLADDAV